MNAQQTMPRFIAALMAAALATALSLGQVRPAAADTAAQSAPSRMIFVPKDKSLAFRLDEPAAKIVVAQPDTAKIVATTDRSFYVRGVELGSTNLLVYGPGGALREVIDVRVGYDAAALQTDLSAVMPNEAIRVSNVGEGLLLSGHVSNAGVAKRATSLAEKYAPDAVTSDFDVAQTQVILEVRVLEATRTALQDLGVSANLSNNSFTFLGNSGLIGNTPPAGVLRLLGVGNIGIEASLQMLEEKGVIRTLARPNLMALSGEKASFLAGGEFPFPVPSGRDLITIEFRPYGVKLNFTPVVQENGLIRLAVEPEVSALDTSNTLRISGVTIPALTVRRANTTVELASGDSLAIGGLFQRDYASALRQLPGLGNIPVLGALFRSSRWKRNETELLIIVTPRMATAADVQAARTQTVSGAEPDPIDLILKGKALDKKMSRGLQARR